MRREAAPCRATTARTRQEQVATDHAREPSRDPMLVLSRYQEEQQDIVNRHDGADDRSMIADSVARVAG